MNNLTKDEYLKYQLEKQKLVQKINKHHIELLKSTLQNKNETNAVDSKPLEKSKINEPLSIDSSFVKQSDELKQWDQLITAWFKMLWLLMNSTSDPKEFISKLILSNSLKVELMIISPERLDHNSIASCIKIISGDVFENSNYQEVISILINFTICWILINAGYHKFNKQNTKKEGSKILIQNEGYQKPLHETIFFGDTTINSGIELIRDQVNKTPALVIHKKTRKKGKGSIQYANLDIFDDTKTKIKKKRTMTASVGKRFSKTHKFTSKYGNYVQMKRFIFTKSKVLEPIRKLGPTLPIWNLHNNLPNSKSIQNPDWSNIFDRDYSNQMNKSLNTSWNSDFIKSRIEKQK